MNENSMISSANRSGDFIGGGDSMSRTVDRMKKVPFFNLVEATFDSLDKVEPWIHESNCKNFEKTSKNFNWILHGEAVKDQDSRNNDPESIIEDISGNSEL